MASLPPQPDPIMLTEPTPPTLSQETPLLDAPVTSEPAEKRAENTLGAASSEQDLIQDSAPTSNVSTPGPVVPGAFPIPSVLYQAGNKSKGTATSSALDTAKSYVGAAGQKVAEYVPGVSSFFPSVSNEPTTIQHPELRKNGLEAVSGESLAKLPDELKEEGALSARGNERNANGLEILSGESLAKLPEEHTQESAPPPVSEHRDTTASTTGQNIAETASDNTKSIVDTTRDHAHSASNVFSSAAKSCTNSAGTTGSTAGNTAAAAVPEPVKGAAMTTFQTAKDNVQTAGDKAKARLPESVGSHLPPHAVQPVESRDDSVGNANNANGLTSLPDDSTSLAVLPEERNTAVLPSHDAESNTPLGKSDGVGRLPEGRGVALLPDERQSKLAFDEKGQGTTSLINVPSTRDNGSPFAPSSADGASNDASIRTLAGSLQGKNEKFAPGVNLANGGQRLEGKERHEGLRERPPSGEKSQAGDSTAVHTGHTPTANTTGRQIGIASAVEHDRDIIASHPTSTSPTAPTKKHGFMDKVKGEIKVLSGKLTHREEKVLEGKRIMGKD